MMKNIAMDSHAEIKVATSLILAILSLARVEGWVVNEFISLWRFSSELVIFDLTILAEMLIGVWGWCGSGCSGRGAVSGGLNFSI